MLLCVVVGVVACGSSEEPQEALGYCAVEPILESKCFGCHGESPKPAAPFSLVGAAAFQETYGRRPLHEVAWEAVDSDFMPLASSSGLEGSAGPLTADEKERLLEWLAAGAPDCEP